MFDERGFTTLSVPGAVIRSHAMDPSQDWLRTTEFAILHTAFMDDGRTLVLSDSLDSVIESCREPWPVSRGPGVGGDRRCARWRVGGTAAAWVGHLRRVPGFCGRRQRRGGQPSASMAGTGLHPYAVLGIGYGRPGWSPIGRIVFQYLDPASAAADQPVRLRLARTGLSLRARQSIADVLFAVDGSRLEGSRLILDVSPAAGLPSRLFQMAYARDMAFAGC